MITKEVNFSPKVSILYFENLINVLDDLAQMIEDLTGIVPEWIIVKDFKGKLVKITKSVSS